MKRITILKFIISSIITIILSSFSVVAFAKEPVNTIKYTIQQGDTFHLLSLRFGTSIEDISLMNKRLNPDNLLIGQKITVPVGKDIYIYAIKKGDVLWKIAKKYNSTVETIAVQNYINDPDLIFVGDILAIPKDKKVVWLSGSWRGFNFSGEVSQEDYNGAYRYYTSTGITAIVSKADKNSFASVNYSKLNFRYIPKRTHISALKVMS